MVDELRYYSRPLPRHQEAPFSKANRPERSIYGKPHYAQNPANLIQACHRTLNALRLSGNGNSHSALLRIGGMEPERLAKLASSISVIRGMSFRHGTEYAYVGWNDIVTSLGVEHKGAMHVQIRHLYQKVMSPDEYRAVFGVKHRRNYAFDAPFTMALAAELEQYGFSLKEAAAALQCELTPQGHQWRLQQLAPLCALEAEKKAQIEAQTAANLTRMREALLRRRQAAGQGAATPKSESGTPSR